MDIENDQFQDFWLAIHIYDTIIYLFNTMQKKETLDDYDLIEKLG